MRFITSACLALLATASAAKSLAPSPTESIGCEPHGDHWHCDGPAPTAAPVSVSGSAATAAATTTATEHDHDHDHDHDHEHEHESGTGSLKPSPTESTGCHAHGDHWHCDGPVGAATTGSSPNSAALRRASQRLVGTDRIFADILGHRTGCCVVDHTRQRWSGPAWSQWGGSSGCGSGSMGLVRN
ncbi:hypothetical protein PG985_009667 [Apiospora marii]|uniref:uncharacterized protein n=1 Tax=Apiospora marii TaxID=335849 RepID=UPI00312FA724